MTSLTSLDVRQLLAAEPFVRALARSLLAEDAEEEVVQQVWLRALRRSGPPVCDARHWLARVVRSVAANLHRADTRRRTHEQAAARPERVPSSLRLLELEETRRSLVAAVDALPADLRTVVLLRYYEGLPPRAIARELGLPVPVVWRRQQSALALLRARLDGARGGRRAWMLTLAPLALAPRGLPWRELVQAPAAPAFWTGVLAMTTKTKILGAATMLFAMSLVLMLWPGSGETAGRMPPETVDPPATIQAGLERPSVPDQAAAALQRVEASAPTPFATTGTLVVHVRYADDATPAADVRVLAWPAGWERVLAGQFKTTGKDGTAVFAGMSPGRTLVTTGRNLGGHDEAEVRAGATTELDLELAGFTLTGIVVDAAATPVAGALVEIVPPVATRPEPVATTGADGRFCVRAVCSPNLVSARAAGYASSECITLMQANGSSVEVQIVLPAAGGMVEGTVAGPDGPVAGAVVQVGRPGESGRARNPPQPAVVRTDAEGRFRAIGLAVGEQPVQVRAAGLGPWRGTCDVAAGQTTSLQVQLPAGATIRGVVRDAEGALVSRSVVSVGSSGDTLGWFAARARPDGTFTLADLPAGEVEVQASDERAGKASLTVHTVAGAGTECELRLSRGIELRGRVLREDGVPVEGAMILGPVGVAETDRLGSFAIANCPEGRKFHVEVRRQGIETQRFLDIDPRAGEVELRVRTVAIPSARIIGMVVDPDGRPLAGRDVLAGRTGDWVGNRTRVTTGADGRFALGPVLPGSWWLSIETAGHPDFEAGPIELVAGATRDAGTIRLVVGGTARVRLIAGDPTGVQFQVRGRAGSHFSELQLDAGGLTSRLLAPGDYELCVFGNGTAEQTVPFSIRAGEETRFELRLVRGVRQRFEVAIAAAIPAPDGGSLSLLVQRGEQIVRRRSLGAPRGAGGKRTGEVWLTSGSYTVTVSCGTLTTTVPFAVGTEEGPVVQLELR